VVLVVLQGLLFAAVTPTPAAVLSSYDVNAAFMSFQARESGIHALWPGAGGANVTKVRFRCAPRPVARRERTTVDLG
jgi:hypothetical protein